MALDDTRRHGKAREDTTRHEKARARGQGMFPTPLLRWHFINVYLLMAP